MKKVIRHASENISVLGYQPNDVLQDLMGRAKAFVLPLKTLGSWLWRRRLAVLLSLPMDVVVR